MVRFARAKGSKASNERNFEEATSWREMKQQMIEVQNKVFQKNEVSNSESANDMQETTSSNTSWAKFDMPKRIKENKQMSEVETVNKKKKSKDSVITELAISTQEGKSIKSLKKTNKHLKSGSTEHPNSLKNEDLEDTVQPKKKKLKQSCIQLTEESSNLQPQEKDGTRKKKKKSDSEQSANDTRDNDKNINNEKAFVKETGMTSVLTKFEKKKSGLPFTRRKPNSSAQIQSLKVGGHIIEIRQFDGFPVLKDDWERLCELEKEMKARGIPINKIQATLKLERRRAEKTLARERKMLCFHCRQPGHLLSECPSINDSHQFHKKKGNFSEGVGSGICYKCGSTEHSHLQCRVVKNDDYKFASCFVCGEQGHISRQCPDNPRGMYPKGGACRACGDVTHLMKDCPKYQQEQQQSAVTLPTLKDEGALEALEGEINKPTQPKTHKKKVVKF